MTIPLGAALAGATASVLTTGESASAITSRSAPTRRACPLMRSPPFGRVEAHAPAWP
ncbi:hypothetical protein [Halorhabdus salina]|uniref:hypothetical protein n=1 Tax=Halorhabdus salina TaxID=2750670 RepID=UPI0015EE56FF|nr:hypothetical protein [Halorhabdus salina]